MAEEAIRGEQIIKNDWANNAIDNALLLDEAFNKLKGTIIETAKTSQKIFPSGDPTTIAGLKEQNKAIEESVKLSKLKAQADVAQQKAEQELLKTQLQREKAEQQQIKTKEAQIKKEQQQIGIINNLRNELKQVTIEWTQTTKAEQLNVNVTGSLAQKKKILTENLKRLEEATGDNRRSVGNYEKSLKGLNGILAVVEKATGLNLSAFKDFGAGLKSVSFIAKSTGLSMQASFALATAGISVLITGIYLLVDAFKESEAAAVRQKEAEKELQKQRIADIEYYNSLKELGIEKELAIAKIQGKSLHEIHDLEVKLNNEKIKKYEDIKKEQGYLDDSQFQSYQELLNNKEILDEKYKADQLQKNQDQNKKLQEQEKKNWEEIDKIVNDAIDAILTPEELKKKQLLLDENNAARRKYYDDLIIVTDNYAKAVHKLTTEYDRLNKTKAGLIGGESGSPAALTDKELENDRKKNEQKINEAKKLSDQLFKIAEDRIKREQELNKQNIDEIDKGIDQQLQLLIAGQKNTYDFMLRQKAKALEEQAALDKKARKEKEAQQIAELFLEFMKVNAKDGFGAAAKSLAETLLAKGLAGGLSGYYEGTEDTGSGGGLDSKGGMLAVLHPHERVLTAKQNAAIGAISNDDLVKSVMRYKIPAEKNSTVVDLQNSILISELKELNNTIKNKKELEVNWNRLNEIILTDKQNGYSVETTYKNSPIIKRNAPFN